MNLVQRALENTHNNRIWAPRLCRFACLIFTISVHAIDDHHFFRASFLFQEPRFEKNSLGTLETWVGVGETNESLNSASTIVSLFDLYGPSNMRLLGSGVPNKDPNNQADLALINLARLSPNDCFGFVSLPGSFKVVESGFRYMQNFAGGFFTEIQLPVRSFRIVPNSFVDLSPDSSSLFPNRSSPEWQEFLREFNAILARYNLSYDCINQTQLGDFIWTLGWTTNYQDSELFDFVDTTLQAGILYPSAPQKNENLIFDIPFGYDGHWGFVATFDMSYGAYDWLTMGIHGGVLAFLNRVKNNVRIKTDINQNGLIKLATANVLMEKGPLWDLGVYAKADHLGGGLSITMGYTYVNQGNDRICSECPVLNNTLFDPNIANSDTALAGWDMHNIHLFIEYDFSKECWRVGPRVGMIFNANASGKRIFKNNIVGGTLGFEIVWSL